MGEQIRGREADTTVTGVQGTAQEFYFVNRGSRSSRSFVLERNGQSVLAVERNQNLGRDAFAITASSSGVLTVFEKLRASQNHSFKLGPSSRTLRWKSSGGPFSSNYEVNALTRPRNSRS